MDFASSMSSKIFLTLYRPASLDLKEFLRARPFDRGIYYNMISRKNHEPREPALLFSSDCPSPIDSARASGSRRDKK